MRNEYEGWIKIAKGRPGDESFKIRDWNFETIDFNSIWFYLKPLHPTSKFLKLKFHQPQCKLLRE
jgi:hypothetical protein